MSRGSGRLKRLVLVGAVLLSAGAGANFLTSDWYLDRRLAATPLDALGRHVVRSPADYRAQYHLGLKLEAAGRKQDALLAYSTAVRVQPDYLQAWKRLGRVLLEQRQGEDADGVLQSALERFPRDPDLRRDRAAALEQVGDHAGAAREQSRALEDLAPGAVTAKDWVDLGRYQFLARQYDAAVESCRKAIALRPDEPDAQRGLGSALYLQGKAAESVTPLTLACRQKPDDAQAHYFLGRALMEGKTAAEQERGAEALQAAIRLFPRHSRAYYWLGSHYSRKGDWTQVARSAEAALRWDPFMAEAHQAAALAYRKLGRTADAHRAEQYAAKLQAAARLITQLEPRLAADGENAALAAQLAELYRAVGRRPDALRVYRHVLRLRPGDPQASQAVAELQKERAGA